MSYGISKMEEVLISCELDSNPPSRWFHWSFNKNNFLSQDLTQFTTSELGDLSVLQYRPTSFEEYGTVQCWGKNDVGIQKVPCTFQILQQGEQINVTLVYLNIENIFRNIINQS